MIGERLGEKFKHWVDFRIACLTFSLPRGALIRLRSGPSLQTAREYGSFCLHFCPVNGLQKARNLL